MFFYFLHEKFKCFRRNLDKAERRSKPCFKTHACLLSTGFYRRVCVSSALDSASFLALQKTTNRRTTDVGSFCRDPRLFVYVSTGLMVFALRAWRTYLSFPSFLSASRLLNRFEVIPRPYIYGISRNLCLANVDDRQSKDYSWQSGILDPMPSLLI